MTRGSNRGHASCTSGRFLWRRRRSGVARRCAETPGVDGVVGRNSPRNTICRCSEGDLLQGGRSLPPHKDCSLPSPSPLPRRPPRQPMGRFPAFALLLCHRSRDRANSGKKSGAFYQKGGVPRLHLCAVALLAQACLLRVAASTLAVRRPQTPRPRHSRKFIDPRGALYQLS
ncbi:hypothetical protein HPB47_025497 [Ixodes persulcatus]|uniref:Uncharacterized protein n=1 Tax=Ixodes persulcatus TaxID=34615 RepID=A0AC60Q1D0_IXOPE|nr:hypothetical protein HPB47_025497 [Ixodes persulcatus]